MKSKIRLKWAPEVVTLNGNSFGITNNTGVQSFMDYSNGWSGNTTYAYDVPSDTDVNSVSSVNGISGWTFMVIEVIKLVGCIMIMVHRNRYGLI